MAWPGAPANPCCNKLINEKKSIQETVTDPFIQLIDSICDEVLPNMVRIYESRKMDGIVDTEYFISLIERKVEQANRALAHLDPEMQAIYRTKINAAYAANIDRLFEELAPRLWDVR